MMQHHDRTLDPLMEHDDPATRCAGAILDRAYAATPPPHLGAAMDRAVYAAMVASHSALAPAPRRWRGWLVAPRRRLTALAMALLLALSGAAGYLRLSTPTPVSAQTVLRHAAAALVPGQAAHLTYTVAVSGGIKGAGTGTAEVWLQAGANGMSNLSAQTLNGAGNADPLGRYVQVGDQVYAYDASHNAILLGPEARENPSWVLPNDIFDGASIAQYLSSLAPRSANVRLLSPRTLDGHSVDVVEVDGWANRPGQRTILYFDAQSYLLRGFDASSLDPSYPTPSWQVRLSASATMDASAVPSGTFSLNAPVTARVYPPRPALDPNAFAAACHSSADVKDLLKSGQSLLAACRATAPGMTAQSLLTALSAPAKASLDAAVAAGVITPAQEAGSLAMLATQLTPMISGSASS